ncbi:glycosyltransferase [Flavobacterium tibetense]|uniref:Mannosyltransferase n=1 Tax=Flavobacterium tibetense TaxID=2233533 RepID=A0A365P1N3_9FLAO|nr:glycosyltransferase [Flavobacterium tibetense]RBA28292.1 mannosyltransferase [Flavobacterium tibetense]
MKANLFPTYNNSFLVYNEAKRNLNESDLMILIMNSKSETISTDKENKLPEIVFISSYPPRECGIATYTQDLKNAIQEKFGNSFSLKICALETTEADYEYPKEVKYRINTQLEAHFTALSTKINADKNIAMVFLQHEFGLFGGIYGNYLLKFMKHLKRPIATTFHSVLPNPDQKLKKVVRKIADYSNFLVVMTSISKSILIRDYGIAERKIIVISHGTHLVASFDDLQYKIKNLFSDRIVLTTFGLLNQGKSIETALEALPQIIKKFPNVIYLIIGKTHPEVLKWEGEKYRNFLYEKVQELHLENNVRFINKYLSLEELMDYLQRTKIYLFTSKDPNQAVSGTLAYAMACGCPVIATPIPHAKEFLNGAGVNYDFQNANQLAQKTIELLNNPKLLKEMRLNALHKISPTSWQNSAIAHIDLVKNNSNKLKIELQYEIPEISLNHIKRMTTEDGLIQFSAIATPNIQSGYTLDDNARALIAVTKHYQLTNEETDLELIDIYLKFILLCQQENGSFLNYVDKDGNFTPNNSNENLEDANGRAIWALGEFISLQEIIPNNLIRKAKFSIEKALINIHKFRSPRAVSFAIKGLYFYNLDTQSPRINYIITSLADNLVSKYRGISDKKWKWFEDYLTYANSILPEAMLFAGLSTGSELYKNIAKTSFDFLLDLTFKEDQIKVISNQGWYQKGKKVNQYGEQPIDVAYTILALHTFYQVYEEEAYKEKMKIAFDWFLGKNHLRQIVYNPKTGGCYDGLEENHINLNQGAESTISYLLSRLALEKVMNTAKVMGYHEEVFQNK